MEDDDSKLVAIIGGGYSGVAAYWALTHSLHDAYIFEVRGALGSLTEVTEFRLGERELMMDTALNIFNKSTSRQLFLASLDFSFSVVQKLILATANLVAFLDELGVSTCGVNFAFSSSQDRGRVEYSWGSLWRTFSSFKDAFWSLDWMLIFNIFRFNYFALDVFRPGFSELPPAAEPTSGTSTPDELDMPECIPVPILPEQTIRGYLNQRGFSSSFCVNYLVPLLCTLLNVEAGSRALDFPIKPFVRLLWDNNLLGVMSIFSPWKILGGENGDFWEIVKNRFPPSRVRLNTRVISVVAHPESSRLTVTTDSGIKQEFDHVIFAVPGQEALRLLSPLASDEEKQVLCGFKSKTIFAALHTDVEKHFDLILALPALKAMPRSKNRWPVFNFLENRIVPVHPARSVFFSYNMECLQDYDPTIPPLFITIATGAPLDHFQARASWHYTRPVLNSQALACQSALPRIQNIRGISYCGSWTGLGHLEDSVRSAFEVAVHHLGTQLPFEIVDASRTTRRVPKLGLLDMPVRVGINVTFISLCLLVLAKDILLAIVRSIIPVVNRAPPAANGNLGQSLHIE